MEAESIPSKNLERKGDWRSWTILNNMTLVKRKHKSSWIILFSLHFSVIAVRFVAVFWFLQHLQLGGYGKSAGKASGKAAGKGSQDTSSALSTWSRFTFRKFLNISFCSFTASAFFLRYSMLFVFDSVRLVPLSTFPLVGGVTAALLLRTLVVFRASYHAGHCPIAFRCFHQTGGTTFDRWRDLRANRVAGQTYFGCGRQHETSKALCRRCLSTFQLRLRDLRNPS